MQSVSNYFQKQLSVEGKEYKVYAELEKGFFWGKKIQQYFQPYQKPWLLIQSVNDGTEKPTLLVFHTEVS